MANQAKVSWAAAEVLSAGDVDAARVAWQGVEVLSTGDVDASRAGWFGAEVLTTGDLNTARTSWVGVEVLALKGVDQARVAWMSAEVLSTAPFLVDTEVECAPNIATALNVSAGWTRIVVRAPWLVVWSSTSPVSIADTAGATASRLVLGDGPLLVRVPAGRDALFVSADTNTVVIVECRWADPFGRRRGLSFGRRGPLN
jgi:hypothetical protein